MNEIHLSDVFKFTQGLGQKGHQIGRKVGYAIELVTFAMIDKEPALSAFLVIEDGVEGATSAKHKVEFAFYNLNARNHHNKTSENLFGIIECKKVGVEQTVKQNFKTWQAVTANKRDFYLTNGYSFTISPSDTNFKWSISVNASDAVPDNLAIIVEKVIEGEITDKSEFSFNCSTNNQILIVQDMNDELFVLGPNQILSEIEASLKKCIVIQIKSISDGKVKSIHVNESLPGPQTPEKAKQASFVSLDVRKKVLGRFDKSEDNSFISILVIGEASHWEEKSRSMVRLCNDFNLIIPDAVLVKLFKEFDNAFQDNYQDMITKTNYRNSEDVRDIVNSVIDFFEGKVLFEMGTNQFMKFEHYTQDGKNKLRLKPIN